MEKRFEAFLAQIEAAVNDKKIPGAVVSIGRGEEIFALKAYGSAILTPTVEPMTVDTHFDIASLSKLTGVWPGVTRLLANGTFTLNTTLSEVLGGDMHPDIRGVTVFQLLTHTAGLTPFKDTVGDTRAARVKSLLDTAPDCAPGEKVMYSDLSFIFLGEMLARAEGMPLEDAAVQIFRALSMNDTGFNPPEGTYCAATEIRAGETLPVRGRVHDERAMQLGGVAGHAGVFSTAMDLSRFCAALLPPKRSELFDSRWIHRSFANQTRALHSNRGLGWIAYAERPEGNIVGHTGFTGTSLWLDDATGLYVVLLTNRVHPTRENGFLGDIRARGFETVFGVPYP